MDTTQAPRYRISVHRVAGCYIAATPCLPGCSSRGATAVEAIENVRAAVRGYRMLAQVLAGERAVVELEISA